MNAVIRSAASSPEKASRPLISSNVSRSSASDIFDTDAPRFGEISIDTGVFFLGRDCEREYLSFVQVTKVHGLALEAPF